MTDYYRSGLKFGIFTNSNAFHNFVLLKDGSLYAWGYNYSGRLGIGTNENEYEPVEVTFFRGKSKIKEVFLGAYHSMALLEDGSLYVWGKNDFGQLGIGTTENKNNPVKITFFEDKKIKVLETISSPFLIVMTRLDKISWELSEIIVKIFSR